MARPKLMRVKRREVHSSDEIDYVSPSISNSRNNNKRMRHSILPPMPLILQSMSQQQVGANSQPKPSPMSQPQTARHSAASNQRTPANLSDFSSDCDSSSSESSSESEHVYQSSTSDDSDDAGAQSESNGEDYEEHNSGAASRRTLEDEAEKFAEASAINSIYLPHHGSPSDGHLSQCDHETSTPAKNIGEVEVEHSEQIHTPNQYKRRSPSPDPSIHRVSPSPEVIETNQPPPKKKFISNNDTSGPSGNVNSQLLTDALMNLHSYMDKLMDSHKDFIQAVRLGLENMRLVLDKV